MQTTRRTGDMATGPQGPAAQLRVVRGMPTEAELAALVVALAAVSARAVAQNPARTTPPLRPTRDRLQRVTLPSGSGPAAPHPSRARALTRRWTPR